MGDKHGPCDLPATLREGHRGGDWPREVTEGCQLKSWNLIMRGLRS